MLDAVIIGAGVSGLHTAWRLQQAGQKVVVCEARDRAGGRLLSAKVLPDLPTDSSDSPPESQPTENSVDLGATWIWREEPKVTALVRELGVTPFPHYERGALVYDLPDGPVLVPGPDQGRTFLRVTGGTAAITDTLLDRLEAATVRLSSTVTKITQQGSHEKAENPQPSFRVDLRDQPPLEARQVVLALPPALAMTNIAFTPKLPSQFVQLASATPVWMGNIVKTVVIYESPFWREKGLSGAVLSALGPLSEIHDASGPEGVPAALFGFTGIPKPAVPRPADSRASVPKQGGPPEAFPPRQAVLAQLTRVFGPAAGEVREFFQQDWSREPHTSPPDVAAREDYDLFGHGSYAKAYLGGGLHFCSCETSGFGGHIEDALHASARTVSRVLDHLGRP
ncbi:MAG: FAD-dependent oxidoreductase [Deltaproteobacteria bacterium]|nr:FAD-dependent oxidoreductase [Deltaproteobacteria bacterium]